MSWIYVDNWKYTPSGASHNTFVNIYYDDTRVSPTTIYVKFSISHDMIPVTKDFFHSFTMLLNPWSSSRSIYHLKPKITTGAPGDDCWPYWGTTEIKVTKAYKDAKFKVPDFWICESTENTSKWTAQNLYDKFKSSSMKREVNGSSGTTGLKYAISNSVASDIGGTSKGKITITDNKNNTFTIKGEQASAGTLNPVKSCLISWGYTSECKEGTLSTSSEVKNLTIVKPSDPTRKVYAKIVSTPTYGGTVEATGSGDITQYCQPGNPTNLKLTYQKSRLTIKENWTFSWTSGSPTNKSSPIAGHRVRLYKDTGTGKQTTEIKNSNVAFSKASTADYAYDINNPSITSFTINPAEHGFKPGDKVHIEMHAFVKDPKGNYYWSGNPAPSQWAPARSDIYTVQNAGVMRIKVDNEWKEGQVYVNVDNEWREAEVVAVNINGEWKESE